MYIIYLSIKLDCIFSHAKMTKAVVLSFKFALATINQLHFIKQLSFLLIYTEMFAV